MKVLIVENEIYLAQSISSKLADFGYNCEIATNTKEALKDELFDVVLLSTGLNRQDIYPIIKKYQTSIIILLISYISSDTVSNPIKAGADDYIQKPFMIEELVRKIKLFESYRKFKVLNKTYEKFIEDFINAQRLPKCDFKKIKLPLLLITQKIQYANSFVFLYAKDRGLVYEQISAKNDNILHILKNYHSKILIHITNFNSLDNDEKDKLIKLSYGKSVLISSDVDLSLPNFDKIIIDIDTNGFESNEILTINEYVKYVISCYQDRFPDTELSKKLGISRKSLWEKRKKYEITKKK